MDFPKVCSMYNEKITQGHQLRHSPLFELEGGRNTGRGTAGRETGREPGQHSGTETKDRLAAQSA